MSNRVKIRGVGGVLTGVEKGLRLQLLPYINQIAKGMKDLAAQMPAPKKEGK